MVNTATKATALCSLLTFVSSSIVGAQQFEQHSKHHYDRRAAPNLNPDTISITDASQVSGKSYDYVIVGGGTAGLAIAARLAENEGTTVAVIEGGGTGDEVMERVLPPANAYYNGIAGPTSEYDWHFYTSNQTGLGNRPVFWPRGKLLGGSSAVNGVYMTPGSKKEHDTWSSLYNNGTSWDWDHIEPYYKKHQTFEPPTQAYSQEAGGIVVDEGAHGYEGPIHYSRAGYFFQQISEWMPTWANLGVGTVDQAAGITVGSYITTSAIRTSDQSRSYSRSGYFPTPKSNVEILTGYTATKINFNNSNNGSNVIASGVSFQASSDAQSYSVLASKEVILAAGVIGSPHLLQLSGVGPADLLQTYGIDVIVDLPGVGAHLQDHVSTALVYSTTAAVTGDLIASNSTFNTQQLNLWQNGNGNQSLYSAPNEAITYANLTTVLGETAGATYMSELANNLTAVVEMYGFTGTIAAGYEAIYNAEMTRLVAEGEAEVEFLMANTGWNSGESGKTATLQFALQHPFSRGSLQITSNDPFTMPSIDPGYLTHPGDIIIMREALKFLRRVANTSPLSDILGSEISPGLDTLSTDDDAAIESWIRRSVGTEYHPAGTCSMLPLELGGCVDDQARVHGIANLRVIDSSVIPVGLAAHLCSPTYAIAELGAAMVKGETLLVNSGGSTPSGTGQTASATSSGASANATSGVGSNAADASDEKTGGATTMHSSTCLLAILFASLAISQMM